MQATLQLDTQYHVGEIDPRIFSGFLEHLGRAVYEGIFDPGNPLSDERGFRKDVLDLLKPLGMPVMRYPGGNFVSCYECAPVPLALLRSNTTTVPAWPTASVLLFQLLPCLMH